MPKIKLQIDNQTAPLEVLVQRQGQEFSCLLADVSYSGRIQVQRRIQKDARVTFEGCLSLENRVLPFYMIQEENGLQIWIDGKTHCFELPASRNATGHASAHERGGADAQNSDVEAPMPGNILKVLVQPDQAVDANQPLIIMESMKMEMTLSAPHAGIIKAIYCQEGTMVAQGLRLIEFKLPPP